MFFYIISLVACGIKTLKNKYILILFERDFLLEFYFYEKISIHRFIGFLLELWRGSIEKPPMVTAKSNVYAFLELDGEPTGEVTPHTFTELSLAPHTFKVYYNADYLEIMWFSSTRVSILVLKKQLIASKGEFTIGSFSLNDVFKIIGTPVLSKNFEIIL